jgi:hypothetical protein
MISNAIATYDAVIKAIPSLLVVLTVEIFANTLCKAVNWEVLTQKIVVGAKNQRIQASETLNENSLNL